MYILVYIPSNKCYFSMCPYRIGSNIHAVIATTVSIYTFLYDEGTSNDPFWYVAN